MNYWASEFDSTGEIEALNFVAGELASSPYPVVFDVGANVGDFSLACLQVFDGRASIFSFEPSASTFATLSSRCNDPAIRPFRLGFSNAQGEATLHSSEPGSSIASLENLDKPVRAFRPELDELVSISTIDAFCLEHGIQTIDFLKLDIEGHETKALLGASRLIADAKIRFIQFEFGENSISARTYLSDIVKLLTGFKLYRIVPGGLVPWTYSGGANEIFATMNYLAVRSSD